jgi:serine/threonine protein kinase
MEDTIEHAGRPIDERFPAVRVISRTARSVVYLARDVDAGRPVALKVLLAPHRPTPDVRRTLETARRLARLRHPHVVPVLEAGSAGGTAYVVSAYVEGETLRRRLDRERHLPLRDAALVAAQVADGLAHLHSHGLAHGDVQPEHVLLSGGRALLLLSETVEIRSAPCGHGQRNAGSSTGSADAAVRDLIGLGSLLYEAISGHPPRAADVDPIEAPPLVPLSLLRPSTPGTLETIVDDALDAGPCGHTAAELGDRLRRSVDTMTALRCAGYREACESDPSSDEGELGVISAEAWWGALALVAAVGALGALLLL